MRLLNPDEMMSAINQKGFPEAYWSVAQKQLESCEEQQQKLVKAERERIIKALEYKSEECTSCGCDCSESLFSKDCAWWQELKPRIREGL